MQREQETCTWCGEAVAPQAGSPKAWLCRTCDADHERDATRPHVDGPKEAYEH